MKKQISIDDQVAALRPLALSGLARQLHNGLLVVAVLLAIASLVLGSLIPIIFAVFLGIVGLVERQAGPNLAAAIKAYDTLDPSLGEVEIIVDTGGDNNHYRAVVREEEQPTWTYEFIPQRWTPVAGRFSARIWKEKEAAPPLLTVIKDGLLIPRGIPHIPGG